MAKITITPKLLRMPEAEALADLRSVRMDIDFSLFCFERFDAHKLFKMNLIEEQSHHYALATAALIHYRRAFNSGVRKHKLEKSMIEGDPEHYRIHKELCDIANWQISHSVSSHELIGAQIQIAIEEDGRTAAFQSMGNNSTVGSLMSEQGRLDAISHIRYLISEQIEPEQQRLEAAISEFASKLSSDELMALPDGFPPNETNLLKRRTWPREQKF